MTESASTAAADPAAALELRNVRSGYSNLEVLHGVDLVVRRGQVIALLGPNGAGKTTTLRVASGRLRARSGTVLVDGRPLARQEPDRLARAGICSIPEQRSVFPSLTVTENLWMWTYRGGLSRDQVQQAVFDRLPRLAERRRQLAGTLSGGEQQMLAMSRALCTEAKLLLLDEISMGLAPIVVSQLYRLVADLAGQGCSIVIVEQFTHRALDLADRAAVITQGRIEREGLPAEIRDMLADAYLGPGDAVGQWSSRHEQEEK